MAIRGYSDAPGLVTRLLCRVFRSVRFSHTVNLRVSRPIGLSEAERSPGGAEAKNAFSF